MLITPDQPTSYETYALDTATQTLRELVEVIKLTADNTPEGIAQRNFNINRVYAALAQLTRVEI